MEAPNLQTDVNLLCGLQIMIVQMHGLLLLSENATAPPLHPLNVSSSAGMHNKSYTKVMCRISLVRTKSVRNLQNEKRCFGQASGAYLSIPIFQHFSDQTQSPRLTRPWAELVAIIHIQPFMHYVVFSRHCKHHCLQVVWRLIMFEAILGMPGTSWLTTLPNRGRLWSQIGSAATRLTVASSSIAVFVDDFFTRCRIASVYWWWI